LSVRVREVPVVLNDHKDEFEPYTYWRLDALDTGWLCLWMGDFILGLAVVVCDPSVVAIAADTILEKLRARMYCNCFRSFNYELCSKWIRRHSELAPLSNMS
jgi:hypothetical protein